MACFPAFASGLRLSGFKRKLIKSSETKLLLLPLSFFGFTVCLHNSCCFPCDAYTPAFGCCDVNTHAGTGFAYSSITTSGFNLVSVLRSPYSSSSTLFYLTFEFFLSFLIASPADYVRFHFDTNKVCNCSKQPCGGLWMPPTRLKSILPFIFRIFLALIFSSVAVKLHLQLRLQLKSAQNQHFTLALLVLARVTLAAILHRCQIADHTLLVKPPKSQLQLKVQ